MTYLVYELSTMYAIYKYIFDVSVSEVESDFKKNFNTEKFGLCSFEDCYRLGVDYTNYNMPYTVMRDPVIEAAEANNTDHWSITTLI